MFARFTGFRNKTLKKGKYSLLRCAMTVNKNYRFSISKKKES